MRVRHFGSLASLHAPAAPIAKIGDLEGWGGGLHGGLSVFIPWTRGNGHRHFTSLSAQAVAGCS